MWPGTSKRWKLHMELNNAPSAITSITHVNSSPPSRCLRLRLSNTQIQPAAVRAMFLLLCTSEHCIHPQTKVALTLESFRLEAERTLYNGTRPEQVECAAPSLPVCPAEAATTALGRESSLPNFAYVTRKVWEKSWDPQLEAQCFISIISSTPAHQSQVLSYIKGHHKLFYSNNS